MEDDEPRVRPLGTYSGRPAWPTISERSDGVTKRVKVNKTTHRIRFENETESQVTIVIEPKETA